MKDLSLRKIEAQKRQAESDKLSATQKLLKLDLRLGGGLGASKERAKLATLIEHEKLMSKITKDTEEGVIDERTGLPYKGGNQRKPYQKPKRS